MIIPLTWGYKTNFDIASVQEKGYEKVDTADVYATIISENSIRWTQTILSKSEWLIHDIKLYWDVCPFLRRFSVMSRLHILMCFDSLKRAKQKHLAFCIEEWNVYLEKTKDASNDIYFCLQKNTLP